MSQNMRNEQGGAWNNSLCTKNDGRSEMNYDGFEGMNYEQIRQPYKAEQKRDNFESRSDNEADKADEL